ncbi:MAG: trigger factor [Cyclobacteriaceae bacterium]
MDITLEKKGNTEASIKINLKEEDYQPQIEEKVKEYRKKANMKGFRPGKVPAGVIKRMYGKSIKVEEINQLVSKALPNYIREQEIQIVGEPLPDYEAVEGVDWDTQKDFEFVYHVGFASEFNYDISENQKVVKFKIQLTDKELDETIDRLRKQFSETEDVEEATKDDIIHGHIKQSEGELESHTSVNLAEMDEEKAQALIGAKKGESHKFDIRSVFPNDSDIAEEFGTTPEEAENVKGEFTFEVESIFRPKPAELNQEFFDKVFGKDSVEGEEAFREKVRETVRENYDRETDNILLLDIRNTLIDNTEIELPDAFLKRWLLQKNEGKMTEEQLEKEYERYAKDLRWSLIADKIGEDNEIKVEHEDVKEKARQMIEEQLGQSGLLQQLGDNLDPFIDNYLQGENGNNYMQVYNQVRSEKIFDLVKEKITVEEKEITVDEFNEEVNKRQ